MALQRPIKQEPRIGGKMPERIYPQQALTILQEAEIFEQERDAVIIRLLLKQDLESLRAQVVALIRDASAIPTSQIHREAETIYATVQRVSEALDSLYETQAKNTPEMSPESTFTREEQHQFARILLTPLQETDIDPEILADISNDEIVFIGDILDFPYSPNDNERKELQRIVEASGINPLLEKFYKAHNLHSTNDPSGVYRDTTLQNLLGTLKENLVYAARAAKK